MNQHADCCSSEGTEPKKSVYLHTAHNLEDEDCDQYDLRDCYTISSMDTVAAKNEFQTTPTSTRHHMK